MFQSVEDFKAGKRAYELEQKFKDKYPEIPPRDEEKATSQVCKKAKKVKANKPTSKLSGEEGPTSLAKFTSGKSAIEQVMDDNSSGDDEPQQKPRSLNEVINFFSYLQLTNI